MDKPSNSESPSDANAGSTTEPPCEEPAVSPLSPPLITSEQNEPLEGVRSKPFFELFDGLLRRRESYFETIFKGQEVGPLIRWSLLATILLSALYGLTMGAASFANADWGVAFAQSASAAVKVPLLFLISLLVTFPVLYFVIVLMGSRLSFSQTLALILLAVTMNAILLAGCAPIVLFFIFTGSGYTFIKFLHVLIFGFSGAWAMMALWQGLRSMCEKSDLYPKQAVRILQVWILVFGFVGTQMAWSLRPFIGDPDQEFQIFRKNQGSNIYFSLWKSLGGEIGGKTKYIHVQDDSKGPDDGESGDNEKEKDAKSPEDPQPPSNPTPNAQPSPNNTPS